MSGAGKRVVAICGGAVAGSEAARVVAEAGAIALVFEQNVRPYGKIEDGLPRWHDKLRRQEYDKIDANLRTPGVHFVPQTRLGEDIAFGEFGEGLSATLLACGAWGDRALPIEGADAFVGRGLLYQNPFVYWFNHYVEEGFDGETIDIPDGPIVVGGGLASVDVAKILNFVLYVQALEKRGVTTDVVELEHKGIPEVVEAAGFSLEELGVRGCTLCYRRRKRDMPLTPASPKNAAMLEKLERARLKIVDKLERKYLVNVEECVAPVGVVSDGDRMTGMVFRRTEIVDGRVVMQEGSDFEMASPLTVSSIGSVPLPIEGVPSRGELFDYADWDTGALSGLERAFGLGNALTGRGNIKDSRKSALSVAEQVMALSLPELGPDAVEAVLEKVAARQREVGFLEGYDAWIGKNPPLDRR